MTRYVVLGEVRGDDGEEGWYEVAVIEARGASSAIRAYLDGDAVDGGHFVAVPARSWKPVTVKVETKTALKFS